MHSQDKSCTTTQRCHHQSLKVSAIHHDELLGINTTLAAHAITMWTTTELPALSHASLSFVFIWCYARNWNAAMKTWYWLSRRKKGQCFLAWYSLWHWPDEDTCNSSTYEVEMGHSLKVSPPVFPCVSQSYSMSPGSCSICALLDILLLHKNVGQGTTTLAK